MEQDSRGSEYLEAVIGRNDLKSLKAILTKHLGPAAKEPGMEANFSVGIRCLVDAIGGLRMGQSFFYRQKVIIFSGLLFGPGNPIRRG